MTRRVILFLGVLAIAGLAVCGATWLVGPDL
jgi:hypothetical protein